MLVNLSDHQYPENPSRNQLIASVSPNVAQLFPVKEPKVVCVSHHLIPIESQNSKICSRSFACANHRVSLVCKNISLMYFHTKNKVLKLLHEFVTFDYNTNKIKNIIFFKLIISRKISSIK